MKKSKNQKISSQQYDERPIPDTAQPPMIPRTDMPQRPIMPTPYYMYPPGTSYNPIGVPPYAELPGVIPPGGRYPTQEPPIDFAPEPGPPVTMDRGYLQGYLRTVIGRYVRIDFIVGTNMFVDREGTLVDVGIDYVTLREAETDDIIICDLYSIKFVKVFF